MKKGSRLVSALALMSLLAGCGGGGGSGSVAGGGSLTGTAGGGTTGGTTASSCSLRDRQNWAFASLKEWYLFPETLPASLDPTPYSTVDAYIDALTATARAQGKDRFFTYLTSIASEDAFFGSGSSAGFGVRLSYDTANRRVFVVESFEGTSALAAGIDRGTEILAIGVNAASLQNVSDLMAAGGAQAVSDALGASTAGTTRALKVTDAAGTRVVTIAKTDYTLTPVSSRYGASIIDEGGRRFGYVNLRTFIDTADPALRSAFANFRAAGVTDIIVDLRYNGGGLISIAETFGDLMGANRSANDVFDYVTFRPEKASNNTTRRFQPQPQSIAPTRIAFIGTGGTASASELVINGMLPYYHANEALVGANTYGKPVGQIAVDRTACDDRFRIIALRTENAEHQGDYYAGLATKMDVTCAAGDDYAHPLGDPREASVRQALDFLEGKPCTRIVAAAGGIGAEGAREAPALLSPERPTTAQREVPGLF